MFRAAVIIAFLQVAHAQAPPPQPPPLTQKQVPLTSDSSKVRLLPPGIHPGRAFQYMPPLIDVGVRMVTNYRPLIVEITIVSNVEQTVRWWGDGVPHTNVVVLSTNVVSITTNQVSMP